VGKIKIKKRRMPTAQINHGNILYASLKTGSKKKRETVREGDADHYLGKDKKGV